MNDIKFACVRYLDKKDKNFCIPVNFIKIKNNKKNLKTFCPTHIIDFDRNKIYFVKWLCPENCHEVHQHNEYFRAQIGFLMENKTDFQEKLISQRLRFCTQQANITSSDYEEEIVNSFLEVKNSTQKEKIKKNITKDTVAMKISQEVLNTHSTNNFPSRRRKIDDIMVTSFMTSSIPNDLADREGPYNNHKLENEELKRKELFHSPAMMSDSSNDKTINQCSSPKRLRSNIQ
ncbi:uncharacterized protein [Anoplolepis gracilipes]|uniref:uncharacterized protein isoform X2 n=1 Tax=Anoplolepis gracilipes TaxID=354296 RepID=UPI003B9EC39B